MSKVLALIPARSGSKRLRDKNIRVLGGKPLMAWSIEQARASKFIDRVIVSTDSQEYAEIAKRHGAEVPFLRPGNLSQDQSTDIETFIHALEWLDAEQNYVPDLCVHLRPTNPVRKIFEIDNCIQMMINDPSADSLRSVSRTRHSPYKMWTLQRGVLNEIIERGAEFASLPDLSLPEIYLQNACIDVIRTCVIREKSSMTGNKVLGYLMKDNYDVDVLEDFNRLERLFENNGL